MAYCGSDSTWATVDDLYDRFGEEFVDKLCIRNNWNEDLQSYVADESPENILRVLELAICDAKALLLSKLSCLYGNLSLLNESTFSGVKNWHMKLIIATLKNGGDCSACACDLDLKAWVECGLICNDENVCLPKNSTFFSVSCAEFKCECNYGSCCCD